MARWSLIYPAGCSPQWGFPLLSTGFGVNGLTISGRVKQWASEFRAIIDIVAIHHGSGRPDVEFELPRTYKTLRGAKRATLRAFKSLFPGLIPGNHLKVPIQV